MRLRKMWGPVTLACLMALLMAAPAFAVPPLPSSFWGTVKINGANVANDTVIEALVNGNVYAQGRTQMYEGNSVYSLNTNGDDTDTAAVDGGHEGDTVEFTVGGVKAAETGVWHGGTNQNVNLTAAGQAATPPPTAVPQPTQTPIVIPGQPTPAPAAAVASAAGGLSGGLILAIGAIVVGAGGATYMVRRKR
jgi:hypothetical protein